MPDTEQRAPRADAVNPEPNHEDAVQLAEKYGLMQTTARPTLPAYVKQLWQRRQFIVSYASARSTATYSASRLGQLWQVLTPLLNAGVYYLFFGIMLGTRAGIDNFTAFLVTGVFVFHFTQRSLNNGAKSISGNLSLIRALHFPRAVLPLSFVLVEFKQLLISMVALVGIVLATGEPLTWQWLLVLPAMLVQMLFNIGISLTMARVGADSADVNQLLPFISRIWLYMSGVFYPATRFIDHPDFPAALKIIMQLNPGGVYIDLYRSALITSDYPHPTYPWGLNVWTLAVLWAAVFLVGGFIFFWRREERYGRG